MSNGLIAILATAAVASALAPRSATVQPPTDASQTSVERGRYLVTVGGCNDCHSPKSLTDQGPIPDSARLLSGFPADEQLPPLPTELVGPGRWGTVATGDLTAWVGPWGVSFAANLTPDPTGMGGWTRDEFIRTLRQGRMMATGRPLLPPMPWQSFAQMTDDDLGAVFDYLQSLKPVPNAVRQPIPPARAPGQ